MHLLYILGNSHLSDSAIWKQLTMTVEFEELVRLIKVEGLSLK